VIKSQFFKKDLPPYLTGLLYGLAAVITEFSSRVQYVWRPSSLPTIFTRYLQLLWAEFGIGGTAQKIDIMRKTHRLNYVK